MTAHSNRGNGTYALPPARGNCPSGKVQFATRKQAKVTAKRANDRTSRVYDCDLCGFFHNGHVPQRVRNGDIDKAAWLAAIQRHKGSK